MFFLQIRRRKHRLQLSALSVDVACFIRWRVVSCGCSSHLSPGAQKVLDGPSKQGVKRKAFFLRPSLFGFFFCSSLAVEMDSVLSEVADGRILPEWAFSCDLEVNYESEENASMVYTALSVDKELQPDKVKRLMSVSNGKLSVHFEAVEARFLRASFSAFVDILILATKAIEQFGPVVEF